MSSLRPAKIVAALFQLIGGSLAEPDEVGGPPCWCERCEQAWRRNQSPKRAVTRSAFSIGMRGVDPG
jgi:hypothetical protein